MNSISETKDPLYNHRLLLEASKNSFLVSTKQLAELTDIEGGSANAKPEVWSKYGFLFRKVRLEESAGGVVWSIQQVVVGEEEE